MHLLNFRFAEAAVLQDGVRDVYQLQLDFFKEATNAGLYVLGVVTMGTHIYAGWQVPAFEACGLALLCAHSSLRAAPSPSFKVGVSPLSPSRPS